MVLVPAVVLAAVAEAWGDATGATAFAAAAPEEVAVVAVGAVLAVVAPDLDAEREPANDGDKTVAAPPLLVLAVPTLMSSRLTDEEGAVEA
jgi:hypothetical protein